MGHQESFIKIRDINKFDDLVNLIREIGKDYYEENMAEPVEIITLNKAIKGDLGFMCRPYEKYSFPKGERFIYFAGDRYLQRSVERLLNEIYIEGVEIYFCECFPLDKIFDENVEEKYATHEEFIWDVDCESEINNTVENSKFMIDSMFIKEDYTLDYLIENKVVKNILTDVEEYGLEYFSFCQFSEQVEDKSMENFATCLCDHHGVFGLLLYQDKMQIFINEELLDSVYLGNDNKIYYLTEEGNIYSYMQENHTVTNKCNSYPA